MDDNKMRLNSGKPPSPLRLPPSSTDCPLSYLLPISSPPPPRFWSLAHSSSFSTPRKKREGKGGGEKFPSRCFHNNRLRQRSLARRSSSNLDPGQIITSFGKPTANEKRKGEKAHLLLSLSSPKRIGCRLSSLFSLVVPPSSYALPFPPLLFH